MSLITQEGKLHGDMTSRAIKAAIKGSVKMKQATRQQLHDKIG